jgi:phosphocarrier protein HPr
LLMLAASKGTSIKVTLNGNDAEELVLALEQLINSKFGEEN